VADWIDGHTDNDREAAMKFHTELGRVRLAFSLAAVIVVGVAVAGCRSVRRGEPIVGQLRSSDPDVQHGKIVFARRCYSCHPGGEGGLGPGLNDKPLPVFAMKLQVRTGVVGFGVMPSFDKHQIPSEDLDDLMKYIKALRKQSKPIETAER
jgi:mono/diheme cytochrome c family protein